MKKNILFPLSVLATITMAVLACVKDPEVKKDETPAVVSNSWNEGFDDVAHLGDRGWVIINNSTPPGLTSWRQGLYESTNKYSAGGPEVVGFAAYSSVKSQNDFISCDMFCGSGAAKLSAWLITPVTTLKNGDELSFYTREDGIFADDHMEVRANFTTTGTNVGNTDASIGDFTKVIFDINPGFNGNYPTTWTKYTYTVNGVTGTIKGRFAFRYYVADGGPSGTNSDMIGVDEVSFVSK